MLTKKFKELWKQGDYKFRLQADGNYLRIWVSDSVRPDEVELEARSKGLQWFLSFFLVFFIESAKKNTTILLDEAGLSLHPLAQKDLLNFINYLAEKNQIIYTTHSPYLVDPAIHTQVVYVNPKGLSTVLQDWANDKKYAKSSLFTIQSALWHRAFVNLDYDVVVVNDTHEQIYLQQIGFFLAAQGFNHINKPILFLPAMHGLDMVVNLLGYYPKVLGVLEGYPSDLEIRLPEGNMEIEDMMPKLFLAKEFSKMHRNNDGDEFDEHFDLKKPFIDQAIDFADKNNLPLELSWRNELAKKMVAQLKQGKIEISEHHIEIWKRIFAQISGASIVKENIVENIVEEIVIDNKQEVSFAEIKKQLFSIKQKINFIEEECEDLQDGEILSKELAKLKKNIVALEKAEIIEEFSESSIAERLRKVLRMIEKSALEEQVKDEFIAKANFILEAID
jgi:energy-coupling factor transporter ATP-binding protein EcfA2